MDFELQSYVDVRSIERRARLAGCTRFDDREFAAHAVQDIERLADGARSALSKAEEELEKEQADRAAAESERDDLQEELDEKTRRLEDIEEDLKDARVRIAELEQAQPDAGSRLRISALESELADMRRRAERAEQDLVEARTRIVQLSNGVELKPAPAKRARAVDPTPTLDFVALARECVE